MSVEQVRERPVARARPSEIGEVGLPPPSLRCRRRYAALAFGGGSRVLGSFFWVTCTE